MRNFWLRFYDKVAGHRRLMLAVFALLTLGAAIVALKGKYSEDISDFFRGDDAKARAFEIYSARNGADRILALIDASNGVDEASSAADLLAAKLDSLSSLQKTQSADMEHGFDVLASVDMNMAGEISDEVIAILPQLLPDSVYQNPDSEISDRIDGRFAAARRLMTMPGGSMALGTFTADPPGFSTPYLSSLAMSGSGSESYTLVNGHFFTPDTAFAIVVGRSPYGAGESGRNAGLVAQWRKCANEVTGLTGSRILLTGGPVIASDNASVLKSDSLLLISLSLLLMIGVLAWAFRSFRRIVLVLVSIGWGWLMAMAVVSLAFDSVSIIVVAMASVVFGIAVNYPLHIIDHLGRAADRRQAFAEIVPPLLTGNITTAGAFLVLVLLESPAMKTLGLFGAVMLAATIIFVIILLPLILGKPGSGKAAFLERKSEESKLDFRRRKSVPKWVSRSTALMIVLLSLVFGFFSLDLRFDSDVSALSYKSPEQKEIFSRIDISTPQDSGLCIAVTGKSRQAALDRFFELRPDTLIGANYSSPLPPLMVSTATGESRISAHNRLAPEDEASIQEALSSACEKYGFDTAAFADYPRRFCSPATFVPLDSLPALISGPLSPYLLKTGGDRHVLAVNVFPPEDKADSLAAAINSKFSSPEYEGSVTAFRPAGMMSSLSESLADNFNFVGWMCGFIVFAFLWASFRSLRVAITAFMPMVIAWVWILGIMRLAGMEFNVVTIILATFIFGQGDDYTIFITEGLLSRRRATAHGKSGETYTGHPDVRDLLPDYRRSVLISAVMLFLGMGVLLFAAHPALRSLGTVTLIGMFSVVLMSWLIPPALLKLLRV